MRRMGQIKSILNKVLDEEKYSRIVQREKNE